MSKFHHDYDERVIPVFPMRTRSLIDFLEIAGTFDSVPHFLPLRKLYAYGIRGRVLELIKSYVCNRCVKIKVTDCY
jgi:hypothetical protein